MSDKKPFDAGAFKVGLLITSFIAAAVLAAHRLDGLDLFLLAFGPMIWWSIAVLIIFLRRWKP
jgi:hypothetical protein